MFRRIRLGHEHIDLFPFNFCLGIAEDPLRRRVEYHDSRLTIDRDHRVLRGFDKTTKRSLGFSLLGKIAHDDLNRRTPFPGQRRRNRLDIDESAIQTHSGLNTRLVCLTCYDGALVEFLYRYSSMWVDKIKRRPAE